MNSDLVSSLVGMATAGVPLATDGLSGFSGLDIVVNIHNRAHYFLTYDDKQGPDYDLQSEGEADRGDNDGVK